MTRGAILGLAQAGATMAPAIPVAADLSFPVGPPNQPATYGDRVSTTAAPFAEGRGLHRDVRTFAQSLKPPRSERPGVECTIACGGFSPPPGPPKPSARSSISAGRAVSGSGRPTSATRRSPPLTLH